MAKNPGFLLDEQERFNNNNKRIIFASFGNDLIQAHDQGDLKFTESSFQETSQKILHMQNNQVSDNNSSLFRSNQNQCEEEINQIFQDFPVFKTQTQQPISSAKQEEETTNQKQKDGIVNEDDDDNESTKDVSNLKENSTILPHQIQQQTQPNQISLILFSEDPYEGAFQGFNIDNMSILKSGIHQQQSQLYQLPPLPSQEQQTYNEVHQPIQQPTQTEKKKKVKWQSLNSNKKQTNPIQIERNEQMDKLNTIIVNNDFSNTYQFQLLKNPHPSSLQIDLKMVSNADQEGQNIINMNCQNQKENINDDDNQNNNNNNNFIFSNNYNNNLDIESTQMINQLYQMNQHQIVSSSDRNQLTNQESQNKEMKDQESFSFQETQSDNQNKLVLIPKFDLTNSKQRSQLLISLTDYANKEFKNQELINAFTFLQGPGKLSFLSNFNSSRKDGDSFYRAIMVSFLTKNFESTNTNLQQNFLFYHIFPASFKKLTSRSNWFPSVNEEALKKHFIFRFNELIEGNIKIASSPRDVATLIIDMVSRDQYFDASCILISRNLSLQAFELIRDNPLYSAFFGEGEKASVQLEFLKGDQEPSELAKIAIAQAFNMTISQENIFYDLRKQHINIQRNTYSPAQIDQNRQMLSCNVINYQAHYRLAFSSRYG